MYWGTVRSTIVLNHLALHVSPRTQGVYHNEVISVSEVKLMDMRQNELKFISNKCIDLYRNIKYHHVEVEYIKNLSDSIKNNL